jgi:hypothetical protein
MAGLHDLENRGDNADRSMQQQAEGVRYVRRLRGGAVYF